MLFRLAARPVIVVLVAASMALGSLSAAHAQPASAAPAAKDKAEHDAEQAAMAANQDWPCIQHKQPILTAAQMWDGPQIAAEGKVSEDAAIQKLVPILTSRRIAMDEAEKDIKAYAEAQPADQRDAKLAELFGAALAAINAQRSTVMSGIEKFQRRQMLRSHKLEQDGAQLAELLKAAETDFKNQNATQAAAEAQTRYDWDARVFQERQKNIPIACEIPVLIEQRAFALAQAIRNQMAN